MSTSFLNTVKGRGLPKSSVMFGLLILLMLLMHLNYTTQIGGKYQLSSEKKSLLADHAIIELLFYST